MIRVPKPIKTALDATGLPWSIESGSRHFHIRLDGRLVGILPQGKPGDGRGLKNTLAQIRRTMKGNIDEHSRR